MFLGWVSWEFIAYLFMWSYLLLESHGWGICNLAAKSDLAIYFQGCPSSSSLFQTTSGTKASIILIACYCLARHKFVSFSFPFSCGFFLFSPPPPFFWSTILKSQKYLPKPDTFYSQQAFNTEIFGIAYLISNLAIAEMLGCFFLFPIQVT